MKGQSASSDWAPAHGGDDDWAAPQLVEWSMRVDGVPYDDGKYCSAIASKTGLKCTAPRMGVEKYCVGHIRAARAGTVTDASRDVA
jgi:hypothetical protein